MISKLHLALSMRGGGGGREGAGGEESEEKLTNTPNNEYHHKFEARGNSFAIPRGNGFHGHAGT